MRKNCNADVQRVAVPTIVDFFLIVKEKILDGIKNFHGLANI